MFYHTEENSLSNLNSVACAMMIKVKIHDRIMDNKILSRYLGFNKNAVILIIKVSYLTIVCTRLGNKPPSFLASMPNSTVLSNGNGSWILNLNSFVEDEDPLSLQFTTIPELKEISIRGKYYGVFVIYIYQ